MTEPTAHPVRPATLAQAAVPIGLLIGLLAGSVALFGDASSSGPNQIALMLAAGAGAIVGLRNGHSWPAIERGIIHGISVSMGALLILLAVGSLIGTWILAGTDLFSHIRHMVWTTGPSFAIALALFTVAGFVVPTPGSTNDLSVILEALEREFVVGPHLLLPVALVLTLVIRRVPAFPALFLGALAGAVCAVLFQGEAVVAFVGDPGLSRPVALAKGCWIALFDGFVLDSGTPALDELLSRGGMASMLTTVWLIISAMMFGAVMETTGQLEAIARRILGAVHGTGSLISATLLTAVGTNVLASDQYISIVLPGRMFRAEYERRRLDPKNLSRALEDAGTITSVLVPWNTCGAYMAGTLGVATLTYAPFCFFNLINPLVAALYGWSNISVAPLSPKEPSVHEPASD